jgi:hypothetical protein
MYWDRQGDARLRLTVCLLAFLVAGCAHATPKGTGTASPTTAPASSSPAAQGTMQVWAVYSWWPTPVDVHVTPVADNVTLQPTGTTAILHLEAGAVNQSREADFTAATDPACTNATHGLLVTVVQNGTQVAHYARGAAACGDGHAWLIRTIDPSLDSYGIGITARFTTVPACMQRGIPLNDAYNAPACASTRQNPTASSTQTTTT